MSLYIGDHYSSGKMLHLTSSALGINSIRTPPIPGTTLIHSDFPFLAKLHTQSITLNHTFPAYTSGTVATYSLDTSSSIHSSAGASCIILKEVTGGLQVLIQGPDSIRLTASSLEFISGSSPYAALVNYTLQLVWFDTPAAVSSGVSITTERITLGGRDLIGSSLLSVVPFNTSEYLPNTLDTSIEFTAAEANRFDDPGSSITRFLAYSNTYGGFTSDASLTMTKNTIDQTRYDTVTSSFVSVFNSTKSAAFIHGRYTLSNTTVGSRFGTYYDGGRYIEQAITPGFDVAIVSITINSPLVDVSVYLTILNSTDKFLVRRVASNVTEDEPYDVYVAVQFDSSVNKFAIMYSGTSEVTHFDSNEYDEALSVSGSIVTLSNGY